MSLKIIFLLFSGKGVFSKSVNDFDLQGNTCPLNYVSATCPVICANSGNPLDCPIDLRPLKCPNGQYYCGDGLCHPGPSPQFACAAVKSICSCIGSKSLAVPCQSNKLNVSLPYYPNQDPSELIQKCSLKLKENSSLTATVTKAIPNSIENLSFKYCAPTPKYHFSWLSGLFIGFYIYLSCQLGLLYYYLKFRNNQCQEAKMLSEKLNRAFDDVQTKEAKSIQFIGYKTDTIGRLVKATIILTSALGIMLMISLTMDYYQMFYMFVEEDSNGLVFVDHEHLSKLFIIFWHVSTLWLLSLQLNKNNLETIFMMQTSLKQAEYILVERKRPEPVKFEEMGKMAELAQKLELWFHDYTKSNNIKNLYQLEKTISGKSYVNDECTRYIFNEDKETFEPFNGDIRGTHSQLHEYIRGLTSFEVASKLDVCGNNEILFKTRNFYEQIVDEFTGIFYLYQFVMLEIWYFYAYYYMGMVLTSIIVVSGIIKVLVATYSQERVLEIAKFKGMCKAFRDNRWIEVSSTELVIGDIIEIEASPNPLSVDCIILCGDVVADESSLTGEALPVAKFSLKKSDQEFKKDLCKVNRLFAGTTILETQKQTANEKVTALVLATGGSTEKGKLVKDILYPIPFSFVFQEHLKIVFPMLIVWGFINLILSILILKTANVGSWFYGMFSISQVLSPLLPAVLVIGQSVSSERLREKGILCVDLNRITFAGKVKVFCFDKTGTLTKEGLDFIGVHEVDKKTGSFKDISYEFAYFSPNTQLAMQTCHSISMVNGGPVGNFVDVEMFRNSRGGIDSRSNLLINSNLSSEPIRILKRYEFNHSHAYMSVICQDTVTGLIKVFAKGSFEKIAALSKSIPSNFAEIAKLHSSQGYYVLAIAERKLEGTSVEALSTSTREKIEEGLELVGLLLFRNELKPETSIALRQLREGGCRNIMITGDNPNTAVFIAKASGMVTIDANGKTPLIIMAEVVDNQVHWHDFDTSATYTQQNVEDAIFKSNQGGRKVELVIVGGALRKLMDLYWIPEYLGNVRVFSRMSPLDKIQCVRLHMSHAITAMCGDGGNDAGALKAAHVGIALTGCNASVVSHFSSKNLSLMSCVDLLREARCSLDISLASYKVVLMYGEVVAFATLAEYYFKVQMSQALWIFIDGCTVPLSYALTSALPAKKLAPSRPTARLLGFETILSVVGQIAINIFFLVISVAVLSKQPFYVCKEFDSRWVDLRKWWEMADNFEGSMLGIVCAFQILHSASGFNIGSKYRQGFFKNKLFIFVYCSLFALLASILLFDPNPVSCIARINCGTKTALESLGYKVWWQAPAVYFNGIGHNVFPVYFRWVLLTIVIFNLAAILVWEGVVIQGPVREWAKTWAAGRWQVKKKAIKE